VPQAGWYHDPAGRGYRWWDGSTWTRRVVRAAEGAAPTLPGPRAGAAGAQRHRPPRAGTGAAAPAGFVPAAIALLVAGGAVLLVIGAVQPWVRAAAPVAASVTRLGTDARAVWLIMLSGVIVALEAGRWLQRHRPSRAGAVGALLASAGTAAVGVVSFVHLAAGVAHLPGATGAVTRSAGAGVPLTAAGCVAVLSGAVAGALHPVG